MHTVEIWKARDLMGLLGYRKWENFIVAIQRGVDDEGFGRIRSKGDEALFGMPTAEMKKKLNMPPARPLADFLPTLTIAAKNLATEMTNYNVEQQDLYGEQSITNEHVQNNTSVRNMLLERKAKRLEKKLAKSVPGLEQNTSMLSAGVPAKDGTKERIVAYLTEHADTTSSELAVQLGVSAATISRYTKALVEQGRIYATAQGKSRVWRISEKSGKPLINVFK